MRSSRSCHRETPLKILLARLDLLNLPEVREVLEGLEILEGLEVREVLEVLVGGGAYLLFPDRTVVRGAYLLIATPRRADWMLR